MSVIIPDAANAFGVLIHKPTGEQELYVEADWNDDALAERAPSFDRREAIDVILPLQGSEGPVPGRAALSWAGTQHGRDRHVGRFDLAQRHVDIPSLKAWQLPLVADTNVDLVYPQLFGRNFPIYEVDVDDKGVAWNSGVTFTLVEGMVLTPRPLIDGETIVVHASDPGRRANVIFEFDVFAPGVTTAAGASPQQKYDALSAMGARAESPFFPRGSVPLQYRGQAGIDGHDFRLLWQMNAHGNFHDPITNASHLPETGMYPVVFKIGERVIGHFVLDWRRP